MTNQPAPFSGFLRGDSASVRLPERFFSDLLPLIDDLAELKLTLYCFWVLHQREGHYRYVRRRDVLADPDFVAGIGGEAAVDEALHRAVNRGTLLPVLGVSVPGASGTDSTETLYFMNTERGRRAVEAMARGDWQPGDLDRPLAGIVDRPNIFALYEQNIGPLTPLIAETLRDSEKTYPPEWITEAIQIAVESNKRSWRYVEAILKRWTLEGKPDRGSTGGTGGKNGKGTPPDPFTEEFLRRQKRTGDEQ